MKRSIWITATLCVLGCIIRSPASVRAQQGAAPAEWRYFGGDKAFTRYAPLDQINRRNVAGDDRAGRPVETSGQRSLPVEIDASLVAKPTIESSLFDVD